MSTFQYSILFILCISKSHIYLVSLYPNYYYKLYHLWFIVVLKHYSTHYNISFILYSTRKNSKKGFKFPSSKTCVHFTLHTHSPDKSPMWLSLKIDKVAITHLAMEIHFQTSDHVVAVENLLSLQQSVVIQNEHYYCCIIIAKYIYITVITIYYCHYNNLL